MMQQAIEGFQGGPTSRDIEHATRANLAEALWLRGELDTPEAACEHVVAWSQKSRNRYVEGGVYRILGQLRTSQGRLEDATAFFEDAITAHCEVGDQYSEGIDRARLGDVLSRLGELDGAVAELQMAIHFATRVGQPGLRQGFRSLLGLVWARAANPDEALPLLGADTATDDWLDITLGAALDRAEALILLQQRSLADQSLEQARALAATVVCDGPYLPCQRLDALTALRRSMGRG